MTPEIKKLIMLLPILGLLLPSFGMTQAGPLEDFGAIKTKVLNSLESAWKALLKAGEQMIGWLKKIWNLHIYPFIHKIWLKIDAIFVEEIEQRKPVIKEEFKKETEEIKQEMPLLGKSLWQKLKDFFKLRQ